MTDAAGGTLIDVHGNLVTDHYVRAAAAAGHGEPDGMPTNAADAYAVTIPR